MTAKCSRLEKKVTFQILKILFALQLKPIVQPEQVQFLNSNALFNVISLYGKPNSETLTLSKAFKKKSQRIWTGHAAAHSSIFR